MSVASTQNRFPYAGNGATLAFAFPNFFIVPTDIKVFVFDTLTKTVSQKTLGVHFTIAGTVDDNGVYSSGGTVNFLAAPLATDYVTLTRALTETQTYKPGQNASANPELNELAWDKLTLMIQRMQDLLGRGFVLEDGFAGTFSPLIPADYPGNPGAVLMQDPTGEFMILGPTAEEIINAEGFAGDAAADAAAAAASAAAAAASAVTAAAIASSIVAVNVAAGNVAQILPLASANAGKIVALLNTSFGSANHIAVSTTGGNIIMGQATDTVEAGECKWYWSDGISQWYIIATN